MFSTTVATPAVTIANPAAFAPADGLAALIAARGWRANVAHYRGGYGAPWAVELRDARNRRVGEGEGEGELDALQAALADALRREEAR